MLTVAASPSQPNICLTYMKYLVWKYETAFARQQRKLGLT